MFRSLMIIAIQLDAESLCLGQIFEVHLPQTRPGGKSLSGPIMGPNESLARTVSWVVQWQVSFPIGADLWEEMGRSKSNQRYQSMTYQWIQWQWQYQKACGTNKNGKASTEVWCGRMPRIQNMSRHFEAARFEVTNRNSVAVAARCRAIMQAWRSCVLRPNVPEACHCGKHVGSTIRHAGFMWTLRVEKQRQQNGCFRRKGFSKQSPKQQSHQKVVQHSIAMILVVT